MTDTSFTESLRILNEIGAAIMSQLSAEEITERVYFHVNELMDAYSFAIGIFNPSNRQIEYIGARENNLKLPPFSASIQEGRFSGWVFKNKKEVIIGNFDQEYSNYLPASIEPMQGLEPTSLMYVPILFNGNVGGILSVRTPVKNAYSNRELEILKTLSVFIAKAYEQNQASLITKQPRKQPPKTYLKDPLSARELEVLSALAKGSTNREIAAELFISPSTVKTHTLNIYERLQAANRTQAIVKAREYGLIL